MWIYLSLLVSVIGLLIFFGSEKPKIMEAGKIMFWTGLLAFLLTAVGSRGIGLGR